MGEHNPVLVVIGVYTAGCASRARGHGGQPRPPLQLHTGPDEFRLPHDAPHSLLVAEENG